MNETMFLIWSLDKLLKKGESAWKSTKETTSAAVGSVVSKTEKVTNTLADKTTAIVGSAAEATKDTAASIVDSSSKLAKNTAEKSSELANKAWDGTKNVASAGLEKSTNAAGHAWEGIIWIRTKCGQYFDCFWWFSWSFSWEIGKSKEHFSKFSTSLVSSTKIHLKISFTSFPSCKFQRNHQK